MSLSAANTVRPDEESSGMLLPTHLRKRSSSYSDLSYDLNRPLPPTPSASTPSLLQPNLHTAADPVAAVSRQRSFSRVSKWLFQPAAAHTDLSPESASLQKAFYTCQAARRVAPGSSARSAGSSLSTLDDLPSPPTLSPQSSPGRGTPTRQRTFGRGDGARRRKASDPFPAFEEYLEYPEEQVSLERRLSTSSVGMAF